jgi:hypothetical protein
MKSRHVIIHSLIKCDPQSQIHAILGEFIKENLELTNALITAGVITLVISSLSALGTAGTSSVIAILLIIANTLVVTKAIRYDPNSPPNP